MANEFDDITTLLGDSIESFLKQSPQIERVRAIDRGDEVADSVWPILAAQGWLAVQVEESRDGMGLGLEEDLLIVSAFARHLVPEPFIECAVMPNAALTTLPPSKELATLARPVIDGSSQVALAWQERPRQTSIDTIDTRLKGGLLNGCKLNIPGAATQIFTAAMIDGVPGLIHMNIGDMGGTRTEKHAADGGLLIDLRFEDVEVGADAVLARGPDALRALRAGHHAGLIAACTHLFTLGETVLDKTIAHLSQRKQFGQRLADFQVLRHKVADMKIALELTRCSAGRALRAFVDEPGGNDTAAAICTAKARASDSSLKVARAAIQLHGAMGYTDEIDIGLYLKSAMRWAAWGGNAHAHRHRTYAIARAGTQA